MLAHGNGTRQQCAANLVKTVRGEVPFERTKGIDRQLFDQPAADPNVIKADVSWTISIYEPRITRTTVTVTQADDDRLSGSAYGAGAETGSFGITLKIE